MFERRRRASSADAVRDDAPSPERKQTNLLGQRLWKFSQNSLSRLGRSGMRRQDSEDSHENFGQDLKSVFSKGKHLHATANSVPHKDQVLDRLRKLAQHSSKLNDEWKLLRMRLGNASILVPEEPSGHLPSVLSVEMVQPRELADGHTQIMYRAQLLLTTPERQHTWYTDPFSLDDLVFVVVKARQAVLETTLCSQVGWCRKRKQQLVQPDSPNSNDNLIKENMPQPLRWIEVLKSALVLFAKLMFYVVSLLLPFFAVWYLARLVRPFAEPVTWMIAEQLELQFDLRFKGADWLLAFLVAMQFWFMIASILAGVTEIAILPAKAILHFESKDKLKLVRKQLDLLLSSGNCFDNLWVCNFLNLGLATYSGKAETQKEGRVFCRRHESAEVYFMQAQRRRVSILCFSCEWRCTCRWSFQSGFEERWCVLGNDGISFFKSIMDDDPSDVLFFDTGYSMFLEGQDTLLVCCSSWVLELFVGDGSKVWLPSAQRSQQRLALQSWCNSIAAVAQRSLCTKVHRFGSFAPMRCPSQVKGHEFESLRVSLARFLIRGRATFRKIAESLNIAKREIFILGWWVSPHLPLIRDSSPAPSGNESCLSALLRRAADRGVRVYVLMWHETYLPNDSAWTASELNHPGIFVIRHRSRFDINLLWSHHEKIVVIDQQLAFVGGLDLCLGRYDDASHQLSDSNSKMWSAQDYSNPRLMDFAEVRQGKDILNREWQPRMPWQDVHCMLLGLPAHDIARHCIERWNFAKWRRPEYSNFPTTLLRCDVELCNERLLPLLEEREDPSWPPEYGGWQECNSQIVRSVGRWSAGTRTESSVHEAYCNLIQAAEQCIYIENQFFCSGLEGDESVGNRVVEALLQRVVKAHVLKEDFHVAIILPLLPALDGQLCKEPSPLLYVMHWQLRTLRLFRSKLAEAGVHFQTYVSVFGLRTNGFLERAGPVTEEIYVHSKLLIVDDRHVIIGSANINDRSLLGMRDSELCVVIQDDGFAPATSASSTSFACNLRTALLACHLDWNRDDIQHIRETHKTIQGFWLNIQNIAKKNSDIYEELFGVLPSDSVRTWSDLSKKQGTGIVQGDMTRKPSATEFARAIESIQGNIVSFPLDFLIQEDLAPSTSAVALKPTMWQPDAFN